MSPAACLRQSARFRAGLSRAEPSRAGPGRGGVVWCVCVSVTRLGFVRQNDPAECRRQSVSGPGLGLGSDQAGCCSQLR